MFVCFCLRSIKFFTLFFFFLMPSRFLPYGFYGTFFGRPFFISNSFLPILSFLFLGGATGLRGTFPGHPRPFHLTFTDIHNTYTPMGAFSRRDSNPCWPRGGGRKSVALPSTTLPSAPNRHTHTSMARRRFLPSKKSSPFGGIRTH
jgi:hypothetical protein